MLASTNAIKLLIGQVAYLFRIVETDLTYGHTAILFKIGPRCVDDSNVVFLIACVQDD